MLIKPRLTKHSPGSSFWSSHNLTHNPHLMHFAFSKINPLLALIFFSTGAVSYTHLTLPTNREV